MLRLPLALVLAGALAGCQQDAADRDPVTLQESAAYVSGFNQGQQLHNVIEQDSIPFDTDLFLAGMRAGLRGDSARFSEAEVDSIMRAFGDTVRVQQEGRQARLAARNLSAQEAFLAENAARDSVQTTASGLQYVVVEEGDGPRPTADQAVTVHYRGRLLNGEQFDSSYDRGQPATFPVSGVIPGWTEALQLMPQGSTYRLYIPSDLAYGRTGPPQPGSPIGPNELLVFDVELLEVGATMPQQGQFRGRQ